MIEYDVSAFFSCLVVVHESYLNRGLLFWKLTSRAGVHLRVHVCIYANLVMCACMYVHVCIWVRAHAPILNQTSEASESITAASQAQPASTGSPSCLEAIQMLVTHSCCHLGNF